MKGSIGTATMMSNTIGLAAISYPRGNDHYDEVLRHLGGLAVGESKPVPAWD
jgi:hypothetical protein